MKRVVVVLGFGGVEVRGMGVVLVVRSMVCLCFLLIRRNVMVKVTVLVRKG